VLGECGARSDEGDGGAAAKLRRGHLDVERMESLPAALQNSLRSPLEEVESLTEKIQALDQQVE